MTIPAAKLRKMIPLLGSDKPGDVLAAASGITRTLKAHGHDWHDIAAHLAADRPQARPHHSPRGRSRWRYLTHPERMEALYGLDVLPDLSPWERCFINTVGERIRGCPQLALSAKQIRVLDQLLARVREETGT